MKEYVRVLRDEFRGAHNLARFMGIATVTVHSWCNGKREARGIQHRFLYVLGMLMIEAPEIFKVITNPDVSKPHNFPTLSPMMRDVMAAQPALTREKPAPPVYLDSSWTDEFWYERTVTQDEADEGAAPPVVDSPSVLNQMTETQEGAYWRALKEYEKRTGRVKPE